MKPVDPADGNGESRMPVQYLTDAQGKRVAVQIPIDEWENLQAHIEYADDVTHEEIAAAKAAWDEHALHPDGGMDVEEAARRLGIDLDA
jgi:hypothetical protein